LNVLALHEKISFKSENVEFSIYNFFFFKTKSLKLLIVYKSSLSIINSICKSAFWYIMLMSEFCYERILIDCCNFISMSLSKHYALFLWKFNILRRYEEYKRDERNDYHHFAYMLKNYMLIAIKYEIWNISSIELNDC